MQKTMDRIAAALVATGLLGAPSAAAQDSLAGKNVTLIIGFGAGGGYDLWGRLVARHIGKHLPGNPTVIVRTMPGAGGIVVANHLYNLAARNGTVIGMLDQSIFETQLFSPGSVKADVRKMNWIGRVISNNAGLYSWHAATVKRIEDSYTQELIVSSSGRASQIRWTMLKNLVGVKFKLITGHKGATEGLLGMERGEVDAVSMPWTVFRVLRADWLRDKKVNVLLQTGLDKAPDLPDVPRLIDLGRDAEQRTILELFSQSEKIGRSFTAPPDMPPERVAELRAAYAATMQDADFLADAKVANVELDPMSGADLQAIIAKFFDHPPALVAKALALTKME